MASSSGLGVDQSPDLVFGIGAATRADRLVISWADGHATVIENPTVDRPLRIAPPDAEDAAATASMDAAPRPELGTLR